MKIYGQLRTNGKTKQNNVMQENPDKSLNLFVYLYLFF